MTSIQERLQQLLDGELDPSEIADDPTLVSLADRLYGIKIAAVQPVKPRDATPSAPVPAAGSPTLSPTDLLVEVIGPAPVTRLAFRFRGSLSGIGDASGAFEEIQEPAAVGVRRRFGLHLAQPVWNLLVVV